LRPYATAFLAGFTSLALEVTLVRMLSFFLGNGMDFLAIPLALLGLAIGSIYAHFRYQGPIERLASWAAAAVLPATLGSLIAFFLVCDLFFYRIHVSFADPGIDTLRLVVYGAILLPPFVAFGALFAALFASNSERMGRMYAADLAGAALGCAVAPVVLTFFGLAWTLAAVVLAAAALGLADPERSLRARIAALVASTLTVVGVAAGVLFHEHPSATGLANTVARGPDYDITSMAVRWNEIARTALLRVASPTGVRHYVVQDNGLSNVDVRGWRPGNQLGDKWSQHHVPWSLGRPTARILTMFAGAGRDMMNFDELSHGASDLVGVELNPAVVALATSPAMASQRIGEFLARPNVHLVIQEGRDFLDHDTRQYDFVYVANNGAVFANRTGHTRKFLDTEEAMAEYLEHLAPGGMILFVNQPIFEKVTSFGHLLPAQGAALADSIYVFGMKGHPDLSNLLVSPTGFTPEELGVLDEKVVQIKDFKVVYAPGRPRAGRAKLADLLGRAVTDDRPFIKSLQLDRLRPIPSRRDLNDLTYVSAWVKVFTVLLFGGLATLAGGLVMRFGRGEARVPAAWVGYLLLTGIGYMCVEIGLIARTELFVGKPLYAVALNLAVFLVASAAGSFAGEKRRLAPGWIALLTLLAVGWGQLATGQLTQHGLSLPLVVKALGVALAVGPAGMALGTFYPYAVGELVRSGRAAAVPATYALTTLSSVLGSAFAMTAIVELGFSRVIGLGAVTYALACCVAVLATRSRGAGKMATRLAVR
jgi:hypothetical protein